MKDELAKTIKSIKEGEKEEFEKIIDEYSCAAEPPVQCNVSHLSRRSEPQ